MIVYLGIGSNLGDRLEHLTCAVRYLGEGNGITVTRISPVYETDPVGGPPQGNFLNAAVAIDTEIDPHELLRLCKEIERLLGRTHSEKWGPRVIDIDILLYGDEVVAEPDMIVPHPSMAERGFVLYPLADIAPEAKHPVLGVNVSEMRERAGDAGVRRRDDLVLSIHSIRTGS